jgi:hypothetical protein
VTYYNYGDAVEVIKWDDDGVRVDVPLGKYVYRGQAENARNLHVLSPDEGDAVVPRMYLMNRTLLENATRLWVERPERGQSWRLRDSLLEYIVLDVTDDWVVYESAVYAKERGTERNHGSAMATHITTWVRKFARES